MGTVFIIIMVYVAIVIIAARVSATSSKRHRRKDITEKPSRAEEHISAYDSKEALDTINSRMNRAWNSMVYGNPEVVPVGSHKSDLAIINERLLQVKSRLPEEIERRESELSMHRWTMENLLQEQLDATRETQSAIRAEQLRQQQRFAAWAIRTTRK